MTAPRILIAYHTSEGQTAKVADRIADRAREAGATVDEHRAESAPAPDAYDVVIAGDSIHTGSHSRQLTRYLKANAEALEAVPVALFQVSMTSATADEEHTARAHEMLADLTKKTGVDPDIVGLFAGALAYTRYGWFKRHLMQRIAKSEGGDTDTSVDHEYTDWDAVDAFARDAVVLAVSEKSAGADSA